MSEEITLKKFSSDAKSVVIKAQVLADRSKHKEVSPTHFLYLASQLPEVVELLKWAGVEAKEVEVLSASKLQALFDASDENSGLSMDMIQFLKDAEITANGEYVSIAHLMSAVSDNQKNEAAKLLNSLGIGKDVLRRTQALYNLSKTPTVNYLRNLTDLARADQLDPIVGRNTEVRRMIQILGRRHKNHPLLVGEVGVGKKTIVNALAMKIASGNVSSKFSKVNVYHLDAGRLTSGVKQKGDVEGRMEKILASLDNNMDQTILYIHGIDALFNQSSAFSGSGELISSLLAKENLRLITSTTPDGFKKLVEKDSSLTHQFTPITVEPATEDEAKEILRGIVVKYETYHKVLVGEPAIASAVKLAKRYLQKRALPESAIDLIDEAASRKKFEVEGLPSKEDRVLTRFSSLKAQLIGLIGDQDKDSQKERSRIESEIQEMTSEVEAILSSLRQNRKANKGRECILTEEDVAAVLEDWTGIPTQKMLAGESDKLSKMEESMGKRVMGQDQAIKAVSKAVRRARLGLRDLGKPIGSFLFLGSSGVGKTEISKTLAQFLFDNEKSMIRIDCSEMQQSHMVQRLIGAPPGYAQASEGGMLTEAVMKKPHSVILFDEVEKGHPDMFNILLQVLDDGRLTDGLGKTADFTNTVVIMTSNIGSKMLLELPKEKFETEEGLAEINSSLKTQLMEHLRPELLNRLDETVIFQPLTKETLKGIVDIQMGILDKMLAPREIKVIIDDEVREFLVNEEWNPGYGARPLKRAITKYIQDTIGERVMNQETKEGQTVFVSMKNGKPSFKNI